MNNIIWHQHKVTKADRTHKYGQKPFVIWLTDLPGSGKSTLASAVESYLFEQGCRCYLLDGDPDVPLSTDSQETLKGWARS